MVVAPGGASTTSSKFGSDICARATAYGKRPPRGKQPPRVSPDPLGSRQPSMRPFHLVCLVLFLADCGRAGQPAPPRPDTEVLALEDTLNAAWLRHDTLTLGRLIGADFRGITAEGPSVDRADMLRAAAHTEETATEFTDRTARAFGDVVVTTGRITDRGRRATGERPDIRDGRVS